LNPINRLKRRLDPKFRDNRRSYFIQCSFATIYMFFILAFLNLVTQTAIVAALGATTFIVFAMPNGYTAKKRVILGGYTVGAISGYFFSLLYKFLETIPMFQEYSQVLMLVMCSLSIAVCVFVMVLFNFEHPPAAGLALALVSNIWDIKTLVFIFTTVLMMVTLKKIFEPHLIDLR